MPGTNASLPVTIITHEFFPTRGGIATFVEEMAQACHELGHEIEVWAPKSNHPSPRRFPFPVHRVPLKGTQDFACQFRMARELISNRRRIRKGIIYLPEPGPVLAMTYLQFFKAFRPAHLLLTFHGSEIQRFYSRPAARLLVGKMIQAADRVTTLSRFSHQLLCKCFPMARKKAVITSGAIRHGFLNAETSPLKVSKKVIILTVGRLHPRKGQAYILDALNELPDEALRQIEYWVVGRGSRGNYEGRLRRNAAAARFPVRFLGDLDEADLALIYRRADIFAMTSVNHGNSVEGFGLAYLEASGFGLPVVGHDVGGVPEAVIHGKTGILVPPGDREGLRAAFAQLIFNPDLRRHLGSAGKEWTRQHTWQDAARVLLNGFSASLESKPAPDLALQTA